MSHTNKVKLFIKNPEALVRAAKALGYEVTRAESENETFKVNFYSNSVDAVMAIKPDGWKYPIAVTQDGSMFYDNYNGNWGSYDKLDNLLRNYIVESVKQDITLRGGTISVDESQNTIEILLMD